MLEKTFSGAIPNWRRIPSRILSLGGIGRDQRPIRIARSPGKERGVNFSTHDEHRVGTVGGDQGVGEVQAV